jgi:hypothetical protein
MERAVVWGGGRAKHASGPPGIYGDLRVGKVPPLGGPNPRSTQFSREFLYANWSSEGLRFSAQPDQPYRVVLDEGSARFLSTPRLCQLMVHSEPIFPPLPTSLLLHLRALGVGFCNDIPRILGWPGA